MPVPVLAWLSFSSSSSSSSTSCCLAGWHSGRPIFVVAHSCFLYYLFTNLFTFIIFFIIFSLPRVWLPSIQCKDAGAVVPPYERTRPCRTLAGPSVCTVPLAVVLVALSRPPTPCHATPRRARPGFRLVLQMCPSEYCARSPATALPWRGCASCCRSRATGGAGAAGATRAAASRGSISGTKRRAASGPAAPRGVVFAQFARPR